MLGDFADIELPRRRLQRAMRYIFEELLRKLSEMSKGLLHASMTSHKIVRQTR